MLFTIKFYNQFFNFLRLRFINNLNYFNNNDQFFKEKFHYLMLNNIK